MENDVRCPKCGKNENHFHKGSLEKRDNIVEYYFVCDCGFKGYAQFVLEFECIRDIGGNGYNTKPTFVS